MDYERHISGKTLNLARKSTCLAFNFCHLTNYIKQTSKKNDKKTNKQLKKQTTRRPTCPRSATETSCWREPPRTRLLHILVVMSILADLDIDDDGGEVCQQKDLRHVTMLRMLPRSWLMSSKLDGSLCIALLVMLLLLVIWEDSLDVLVIFSSYLSSWRVRFCKAVASCRAPRGARSNLKFLVSFNTCVEEGSIGP